MKRIYFNRKTGFFKYDGKIVGVDDLCNIADRLIDKLPPSLAAPIARTVRRAVGLYWDWEAAAGK